MNSVPLFGPNGILHKRNRAWSMPVAEAIPPTLQTRPTAGHRPGHADRDRPSAGKSATWRAH